MFKLPVKVQNQSKLNKKLQKKLAQQAEANLKLKGRITEEEQAILFPSKSTYVITKLSNKVTLYSLNNVPYFIDPEGKGDIIPTIYSLWRVPNQVVNLRVDKGVFPHLLNGAMLMAPGLTHSLSDLPHFEANQIVAIVDSSNKCIAVGQTLMSSNELRIKGEKKGKLAQILHLVGDELFLYSWENSSSKYCNLPEELEYLTLFFKLPKRATVIEEPSDLPPPSTDDVTSNQTPETSEINNNNNNININISEIQKELNADDSENKNNQKNESENNIEKSNDNDNKEDNEVDENGEIEDECNFDDVDDGKSKKNFTMDEKLKFSFLQGLKTSAGSMELPIQGSALYSTYILPNRFPNTNLDVKKTTYKKLSKFLQVMAKEGFITVKPLPKGEILVLTVNDQHKELLEYEPFKVKKNKGKSNTNNNNNNNNNNIHNNSNLNAGNNNEEKAFKITELYQLPPDLLPVFAEIDESIRKDSLFTAKEATELLWQFYSVNPQLLPASKQNVLLNAPFARTVFKKKKNDGDEVSKKELSVSFIDSLTRWTQVTRDGITDIKKGKLETITIKEEKRGGNKCITSVKNLETFTIKPEVLAKELKSIFASSTTVNNLPATKNKVPLKEVIVQGKVAKQIADHLKKNYLIPSTFLNAVPLK